MITNQNAVDYGWADIWVNLRSRWSIVVSIGFFVLLTGIVISRSKPAVYESVSEVLIDPDQTESPVIRMSTEVRPTSLNSLRRAETRLDSGALLLQVAESNNLADRWQIENRADILRLLRRQITIETEESSRIIRIHARDISPEYASNLANSTAQILEEFSHKDTRKLHEEVVQNLSSEVRFRQGEKQRIEARLKELSRSGETATPAESGEVNDLRNQLVQQTLVIRSLEAKHQLAVVALQNIPTTVSILRYSIAEDATQVQRHFKRLMVYSIFGLLIGAVVTSLLSLGQSPIKLATELAAKLELPLVGLAPFHAGKAQKAGTFEDSDKLEAYRDLRLQIHRLPARNSSSILFIPRGKQTGIANVVSNLAVTIAQGGQNVLLIDADFRDPQLHESFDAACHPGLADYLSGEMRVEETIIKTRNENLWLMPSGPLPIDPSGLIASKRMDDLIYEMKSRFDYLLVTAPSIHQFSDASALSPLTDHIIAVTSYHHYNLKELRETKQVVESCNATLSGTILTKPQKEIPKEQPVETSPQPKAPRIEDAAPSKIVAPDNHRKLIALSKD